MAVPRTDFVYGYHGCARSVAELVLQDRSVSLTSSENDYDWLGSGIYFWESAPLRAWEWATRKFGAEQAAVLGAKIRLGHCLDLMDIDSYAVLRRTHLELLRTGLPLPKNGKYLHRLDCLVINTATMHAEKKLDDPYDTVRCPFIEGEPVFPDSRLFDRSHIQVSVRNPKSIVSLFPVEIDG